MKHIAFSTYKVFIEIIFIKNNIFYEGSSREGFDRYK